MVGYIRLYCSLLIARVNTDLPMLCAVAKCSIESLMAALDDHKGGAEVTLDEFLELMRCLPTPLRSREAFRSVEETLQRIYKSFHVAHRVNIYQVSDPICRVMQSNCHLQEHVNAL